MSIKKATKAPTQEQCAALLWEGNVAEFNAAHAAWREANPKHALLINSVYLPGADLRGIDLGSVDIHLSQR